MSYVCYYFFGFCVYVNGLDGFVGCCRWLLFVYGYGCFLLFYAFLVFDVILVRWFCLLLGFWFLKYKHIDR